ncbi:MAG: MATE family efflux transporter [Porphyromonas sp.]|nr:MATE family efflux transporter [Porphyromonas sp.]
MQRLESAPIGSLLRYYAIPSIIGQIVNSLYNVVDRIFIGHFVGSLAISGLAITFPILILLQAFGMLVGAGASSRISILLGQKNRDEAENMLGNALMISLIASSSIIIITYLFMDPMLRAFGASDAIIGYARDYLKIVIPGNIFANLTFSYNAVMRATGHPKKAMVTMMIGAVLNIILDPIFIIVFDMGIAGVAWATVISMFIGMIWVLSHFFSKSSIINIRPKYFPLKSKYVIAILSIGISPFLVQLAAGLISVIRNQALSTYGGDLAVGAYGIINSLAAFVMMMVAGLAFGMQPIIGYNYGAGNFGRVTQTLRKTLTYNLITGASGTLIALTIPHILVGLFTSDPELIAITVPALRIEMAAMWSVGFLLTVAQFFQSIGMAWRSILLSLSRQVIFIIPLLLILPPIFGLNGVWVAAPVSDFISGILASIMLLTFIRKMRGKGANIQAPPQV